MAQGLYGGLESELEEASLQAAGAWPKGPVKAAVFRPCWGEGLLGLQLLTIAVSFS